MRYGTALVAPPSNFHQFLPRNNFRGSDNSGTIFLFFCPRAQRATALERLGTRLYIMRFSEQAHHCCAALRKKTNYTYGTRSTQLTNQTAVRRRSRAWQVRFHVILQTHISQTRTALQAHLVARPFTLVRPAVKRAHEGTPRAIRLAERHHARREGLRDVDGAPI
jgi:hypothetical protein